MIQKISILRLRNPEILQFVRQLLVIVLGPDPEKLKVGPQTQALQNSLTVAERIFKKDVSSPLTDVLVDLDEKRDKLLVGIRTNVDSFTYHFNEETRTASLRLKDHLATFGSSITKENYMRESALINKLVTDWRSNPELSNSVAALNLQLWVQKLDDANELFNSRYLERNKVMGNISTDAFREKKEELSVAYDKLIARLNSHYDIQEGAEPFATVARQINELIDKYHLLIIGRKRGETEQPVSSSAS